MPWRKESSLPPSLVLPSYASTSSAVSLSPSSSTSASTSTSPVSASSSLRTRSSLQSAVDSGYASSPQQQQHSQLGGFLPPHPDYMLSRTYENWKIADAATQRLAGDLRALEECKGQLRKARKRLDFSSERCVSSSPSFLFLPPTPPPLCTGSGLVACWRSRSDFWGHAGTYRPKTSRKPSLLQLRFRRKTLDAPTTPDPVSPPPSSSFEFDDDLPSVEQLERPLETLNNRVSV